MESDARIDQLEGHSCLSWLRSHKGCPIHDLFTLEYSKAHIPLKTALALAAQRK